MNGKLASCIATVSVALGVLLAGCGSDSSDVSTNSGGGSTSGGTTFTVPGGEHTSIDLASGESVTVALQPATSGNYMLYLFTADAWNTVDPGYMDVGLACAGSGGSPTMQCNFIDSDLNELLFTGGETYRLSLDEIGGAARTAVASLTWYGMQEGTTSSPVALTLGTAHTGYAGVGSDGTGSEISYYRFVADTNALYSVKVTAPTVPSVTIYQTDFTPGNALKSCPFSAETITGSIQDFTCTTDSALASGTSYFVAVTLGDFYPLTYELTVSAQ